MRRRNPRPGVVELWRRLRGRGYPRHVGSLYRVLHRLGMLTAAKKKKARGQVYPEMTSCETVDKGYGRIEKRT